MDNKIKEDIFLLSKKGSFEGPNMQAPSRNKMVTVQTFEIRNIMENKTKKR